MPELFRVFDVQNRPNIALACLGIHTSADIFEVAQKEWEQAKAKEESKIKKNRPGSAEYFQQLGCGQSTDGLFASLGSRSSVDIFEVA